MTEQQSSEVEKVLLHVSDARSRARRAAETCAKDGADAHIVAALSDAERQLAALHRKLSQGTYYAVPDEPLKLAV
jgi:ABC-type cobalamin/Fe3+-siderophores transport system ATPase subunit